MGTVSRGGKPSGVKLSLRAFAVDGGRISAFST